MNYMYKLGVKKGKNIFSWFLGCSRQDLEGRCFRSFKDKRNPGVLEIWVVGSRARR